MTTPNATQYALLQAESVIEQALNFADDRAFDVLRSYGRLDNLTLHTQKARIDGVEMLHKRIFNHFDLLPKIQQKNGTIYSKVFNEQNYQAVACEFIKHLTNPTEAGEL